MFPSYLRCVLRHDYIEGSSPDSCSRSWRMRRGEFGRAGVLHPGVGATLAVARPRPLRSPVPGPCGRPSPALAVARPRPLWSPVPDPCGRPRRMGRGGSRRDRPAPLHGTSAVAGPRAEPSPSAPELRSRCEVAGRPWGAASPRCAPIPQKKRDATRASPAQCLRQERARSRAARRGDPRVAPAGSCGPSMIASSVGYHSIPMSSCSAM